MKVAGREEAVLNQLPAKLHPHRKVYLKNRDRRSTGLGLSYEYRTVPGEMPLPPLAPGVE
jgi:hypothetical protein